MATEAVSRPWPEHPEIVLDEDAMTLFRAGVRSEVSKYYYERRLGSFLAFLNNIDPQTIPGKAKERTKWTESLAAEFAQKARGNPKWVEGRIIAYILHLLERVKKGELSPYTVDTYKKPIKLFLDMNDITGLNWKRINKLVPGGDAVADDRAYTLEEVQSLAGDTDPRFRAAVLLFASSGIRGGALGEFKVGHLEPVERGGKVVAVRVRVYAGAKERYTAYATPEFWQEYQRYLELRRKGGESVGPGSPAFVLEKLRPRHGKSPVPMDGSDLRSLLDVRLRRLGFREGTVGRSGKGEKRHDVAILHGFRKFFETQCLRAGLSPYTVDVLMGHGTGLHRHYDRRGEDELLDKYLEAVPYLTLLEGGSLEGRQRVEDLARQIQELRKERDELREATQKSVDDAVNRRLEPEIAKLWEAVRQAWKSTRSVEETAAKLEKVLPAMTALMKDAKPPRATGEETKRSAKRPVE